MSFLKEAIKAVGLSDCSTGIWWQVSSIPHITDGLKSLLSSLSGDKLDAISILQVMLVPKLDE